MLHPAQGIELQPTELLRYVLQAEPLIGLDLVEPRWVLLHVEGIELGGEALVLGQNPGIASIHLNAP